tara:strand:- start:9197 stop:10111 length:915 start_codon:yes stop_codon:yes gene_type:complete
MNKNQQQTFKDYLLEKDFSSSTAKQHIHQARFFEIWAADENLPIESISYNDLLHYIQTRRTKVTQKTISLQMNSLRHFFDFLELPHNPTKQVNIKGIKRKKLYHILKPQELEQLYQSFKIPEPTESTIHQNWFRNQVLAAKRNRIMLGFMIWQGVTTTELFKLVEKDVNLREGKVFIAGTRRSNERIIKLESTQIMDLMEYVQQVRQELLNVTKKESDQLFVSTGNGQRINNAMNQFMKNLKTLNPNVDNAKQIRASVITHWLKQHNLRQVQYLAGHRYLSSTEAFLVNDLDSLSVDIEKFHPF